MVIHRSFSRKKRGIKRLLNYFSRKGLKLGMGGQKRLVSGYLIRWQGGERTEIAD